MQHVDIERYRPSKEKDEGMRISTVSLHSPTKNVLAKTSHHEQWQAHLDWVLRRFQQRENLPSSPETPGLQSPAHMSPRRKHKLTATEEATPGDAEDAATWLQMRREKTPMWGTPPVPTSTSMERMAPLSSPPTKDFAVLRLPEIATPPHSSPPTPKSDLRRKFELRQWERELERREAELAQREASLMSMAPPRTPEALPQTPEDTATESETEIATKVGTKATTPTKRPPRTLRRDAQSPRSSSLAAAAASFEKRMPTLQSYSKYVDEDVLVISRVPVMVVPIRSTT